MVVIDILFLFVLSIVFAEIIDFIAAFSDTLVILFALGSVGYSAVASEKNSILLASVFGFLSDIILLNHIFYFTFLFPLLVFFSNYMRHKFNISYGIIITFFLLIFGIYFISAHTVSIFDILFFASAFVLFYNIYVLILKMYKMVNKNAEKR